MSSPPHKMVKVSVIFLIFFFFFSLLFKPNFNNKMPSNKKAPDAVVVNEIGGTPEQEAYMKDIINQFTINSEYLVKIRDHFINEMQKGLDKEGATLAMIPSYVEGRLTGNTYNNHILYFNIKCFFKGKEEGKFLALDLGGTNLRVVLVTLEGEGKYKTVSSKARVSEELKTGPMRNLCGKV
jgi:hexokinase